MGSWTKNIEDVHPVTGPGLSAPHIIVCIMMSQPSMQMTLAKYDGCIQLNCSSIC
jgi:hypothetical protein